jgi:hypothetical protein
MKNIQNQRLEKKSLASAIQVVAVFLVVTAAIKAHRSRENKGRGNNSQLPTEEGARDTPEEELISSVPKRGVRIPLEVQTPTWGAYWRFVLFSGSGLLPVLLFMVLGHVFIAFCVFSMVQRHQRLAHLYELPRK